MPCFMLDFLIYMAIFMAIFDPDSSSLQLLMTAEFGCGSVDLVKAASSLQC